MWTKHFSLYNLDSEKAEDQIKTSTGFTLLNPLPVWIRAKCAKFFKTREYQTNLPAFWEACIQGKKQQLEVDKEQQTASKLGKE